MLVLIISIAVVLTVSAFCSLSEAGLYAVRLPYVRKLVDMGSGAGRILLKFKNDIQQPIAAILIMNTIANTAGATIAGAQARQLFGEGAIIWFATVFTASVLFFAEILPKVIGVTFNRIVAPAVSVPLQFVLFLLFPLVWITDTITSAIRRKPQPIAPEDEVSQFAQISAEEGSILPMEAELVHNVLRLNDVRARNILTPRNVVVRLSDQQAVGDVRDLIGNVKFARIPVYSGEDPEHWTGVVLLRDILVHMARNRLSTTIGALAKPLHFVPDSVRGHVLLKAFLLQRAHLFGVIDEFGSVVGVVTLEDVLESLLGTEIVDESDTTVDLQEPGRRRREELL